MSEGLSLGWDVVKTLFGFCCIRADYFNNLKHDLKSLKDKVNELQKKRQQVETRVETDARPHFMTAYKVSDWFSREKSMQNDAVKIIKEAEEEVQNKCFRWFCPKHCLSFDLVGRRVSGALKEVSELINQGNFDSVVEKKATESGEEMPVDQTMGMDYNFGEVWKYVTDQATGIIGVHGMGGVGKTTLLKKINNELVKTSKEVDFVLWVVVSKEPKLPEIQELIRSKLEIPDENWRDKNVDAKSATMMKYLKEKIFVLLLDDLWVRLDLLKLGVDLAQIRDGSKVIFTTRSETVCGYMGAQRTIKLNCLSKKDAFKLFRSKVGENAFNSHPGIPKIAEDIAEECKGLPLALITTGRAMACRKGLSQWKHALKVLQSYPSKFPGMTADVFHVLKFSYDSLSSDALKKCFLYCCIFPEDYKIMKEELIQLWIGEGFLNDFDSIYDARYEGETFIENLKLSGLLEGGQLEDHGRKHRSEDFVMMHDVIRDMALWLACENGKKKNNILVQEEAKEFAKWKEAERIYLNGKDFDKDQTQNPLCPNLLTLLFRKASWNRFPSESFHSMHVLSVLDLSGSYLNTLPGEIGGLVNLHYLNLSYTSIRELPSEVGNLINLRSLLLDFTDQLRYISGDVVSSLLSLQIFSKLTSPSYVIDPKFYLQGSLMEKLDCLQYLSDVCLTLYSNKCVQKLLNSSKLQRCIRQLLLIACPELSSIDITPSSIRKMEHLESLEIGLCHSLKKMEVYVDRTTTRRDYFDNLRLLNVWICPIKDLTWLVYAPSLQILSIYACHAMYAVISGDSGSVEIEESSAIFSNLTDLILEDMPKLKYIHGGVLTFPCLTKVYIYRCPNLRRLPLDSRSAVNSLKEIKGQKSWWEGLHWDDEAAKHMFDQKFAEHTFWYMFLSSDLNPETVWSGESFHWGSYADLIGDALKNAQEC